MRTRPYVVLRSEEEMFSACSADLEMLSCGKQHTRDEEFAILTQRRLHS
jgi:hypothetical protein